MAEENNEKDTSIEEEKKKLEKSNFRSYGKYFLILLLLVGQAFLAYSAVNRNYENIYDFLDSFSSNETGHYTLKEIVVNPANTNGQRFLLVKLSLELASKEDVKAIKEEESEIRNDIISHLSAKTVDELQGVKDKEKLRLELIKIINNAISSRSVRNLYYSKYVMQ